MFSLSEECLDIYIYTHGSVHHSNLCTPSGGDEVKQTLEQGYCEKNRKKVSTCRISPYND